MKPHVGWALLLVTLAGCGKMMVKPPQERGAAVMSFAEAKHELATTPGRLYRLYTNDSHVIPAGSLSANTVNLVFNEESRTGAALTSGTCGLADLQFGLEYLGPGGPRYRVVTGHCGVVGLFRNKDDALRLWDALYTLQQTARGKMPAQLESDADKAAFDKAVAEYRGQATKPALPEDARRCKVLAETAVREQRYDDAINLYEKGLSVAPWWPEGHYNRALLLADAGRKAEAILEMKKYLQLEPDAPDARAAQDKIYEWGG